MGPLTEGGYAGGVPGLEDFDRYVDGEPASNLTGTRSSTTSRCTG
jgi:hypothetical protein